jgi:hypothetical protein
MKHEWKKTEKHFYLPKNKPELITVPDFKFFTIEGQGNPNDAGFSEYIGVLYSLSYAVKMSSKKGTEPKGYFDYTVYPLEGIWDLSIEARKTYNGTINKNELVFKLMIRQPDFVIESYASAIIEQVKSKKMHPLLDLVRFEEITDGTCIQMMHLGSYDDEPKSFKQMAEFTEQENYVRKIKTHREIYISDARKVSPDKLRTVLRIQVESDQNISK